MAETDALAICNEALVLLADQPMDSFEGAGAANIAAAQLYDSAKRSMLASHPWSFNRFTRDLARLAALPSAATGFTAAYQLPSEVLRIVRVFVSGMPTPWWGQEGDALLVTALDTEAVAAEMHVMVDERLFSPMFRQALVSRMARDLSAAVANKEEFATYFAKQALQDMAVARHANATQRPAGHITGTHFQRLRAR